MKEPTEESVRQELERGPMRPAALSMWTIGTPGAATESKTRRILDSFVKEGIAVKKPGGWYALASSSPPPAAPNAVSTCKADDMITTDSVLTALTDTPLSVEGIAAKLTGDEHPSDQAKTAVANLLAPLLELGVVRQFDAKGTTCYESLGPRNEPAAPPSMGFASGEHSSTLTVHQFNNRRADINRWADNALAGLEKTAPTLTTAEIILRAHRIGLRRAQDLAALERLISKDDA